MENARIPELLKPFTGGIELSPRAFDQFQLYLELLLRWNTRVNLTAVRDPEQIVTRHFGESLFAAQVLTTHTGPEGAPPTSLADVGSGAGFPGVPIRLAMPDLALTLIESQSKKAMFLREVVRTLELENVQIFCGRAERWGGTADIVTLRAVEQFERVLPIAARLVAENGKLCLLIGSGQLDTARQIISEGWRWCCAPSAVPDSNARIVVVAQRSTEPGPPDRTERNS